MLNKIMGERDAVTTVIAMKISAVYGSCHTSRGTAGHGVLSAPAVGSGFHRLVILTRPSDPPIDSIKQVQSHYGRHR